MATDLFGQYYNNPTKSYLYTNLQCNGASADEISFDITNGNGVISNNEETLSTIDLSSIHTPLTQYSNDMKVIDPHSFIYVRGVDYGESYTSKTFGRFVKEITEDEDWMYKTTTFLGIKYLNDAGVKKTLYISAIGSETEGKTFVEKTQEVLEENLIHVDVSYGDGYMTFTANQLGYDFWINHIMAWKNDSSIGIIDKIKQDYNQYGLGYSDEWTEDNEIATDDIFSNTNVYTSVITQSDYQAVYSLLQYLNSGNGENQDEDITCIFLFEDLDRYVPPKKYRNGAMLGCAVAATYPEFNDSDISIVKRSLKIGHLVNRVADYQLIPPAVYTGVPLAVKMIRDVVDTYHSEYEFDLYNKWNNNYSQINTRDNWIDPDEIPQVIPDFISDWEASHVPVDYVAGSIYKGMSRYDAMGLYGYCTYLTKQNKWMTMGTGYIRTTVPDDESMATTNLVTSFIIYNPNDFPVTVKYMTCA